MAEGSSSAPSRPESEQARTRRPAARADTRVPSLPPRRDVFPPPLSTATVALAVWQHHLGRFSSAVVSGRLSVPALLCGLGIRRQLQNALLTFFLVGEVQQKP